jgi:hypothetical protein
MSVLEKLMSIPLFTYHYFEEISLNCQSVVRHLGEYVAGDEKLFHFTGDSGDIRLVLTKPDRIGLWFYQLCAPLHNGASFLLWFKLHHSDAFLGENIPVASVVQSWSEVVRKHGDPETLLTFDSYYLDNAGRQYLRQGNVKYIGSITKERFSQLHDLLAPKM